MLPLAQHPVDWSQSPEQNLGQQNRSPAGSTSLTSFQTQKLVKKTNSCDLTRVGTMFNILLINYLHVITDINRTLRCVFNRPNSPSNLHLSDSQSGRTYRCCVFSTLAPTVNTQPPSFQEPLARFLKTAAIPLLFRDHAQAHMNNKGAITFW